LSLDVYMKFVVALLAILALLAVFAFLARRFGLGPRGMVAGGKRRLAIIEVAAIDAKRRLVLLRRDETEHLILLGTDGATVIETGIGKREAAGSFAGMVAESAS
jgi:flagellar protein FliO/FliZ